MTKRKQVAVTLLVWVMFVALVASIIPLVDFIKLHHISVPGRWFGQNTFDADAWRAGTPAQRGVMVRDLLAGRRLSGLNVGTTRDLLGPPDHLNSDADARDSGRLLWYYDVEPETAAPDDPGAREWNLIVVFNYETKKVLGYGVSEMSS